ncbi:single-stranded DNA-binding protein [Helicobacter turcicus]|uniref:Single-stranded DNA-binding protein n=1 Tax=Helicobacter turcicus TaxID=2867412 RepID=A0ABS7JQ24_9HELI|nr:single-stranded DNA-binding protein [Helicobacter turcicus]MBX7491462.1 single-stranded DNA-binding protein [Helicobacter turcicus]MBX7545921.1 single-stranded DNA-binding protein [Helicobacter turcicus]
MFNKIILVGNLTRDVELRYLTNGSALAKLGLATNRRYKKQDGSQGEEVCFVDVNLFGRTAEVANQYLRRGSQVLIEGRLVLESWTDNNGQKRSKHSITAESMQMLGSKGEGGIQNGGYSPSNYQEDYEQVGVSGNYGVNNNGGTNQNSHNNQNAYSGYDSQPSYQKPKAQKPPKENEIPVIDIDDEEIPF